MVGRVARGYSNPDVAAEAFRGQTTEISFGTAFAFTEQGPIWSGLQLQVCEFRNQNTAAGCRDQSRMDLARHRVWQAVMQAPSVARMKRPTFARCASYGAL